jgi:hypothetical protein
MMHARPVGEHCIAGLKGIERAPENIQEAVRRASMLSLFIVTYSKSSHNTFDTSDP